MTTEIFSAVSEASRFPIEKVLYVRRLANAIACLLKVDLTHCTTYQDSRKVDLARIGVT